VAKSFYGGTYKDRSDRRAAEGGTLVAKANAPVASGTSQAQDFTQAGFWLLPGWSCCSGWPISFVRTGPGCLKARH
jgi:hypothetical protein